MVRKTLDLPPHPREFCYPNSSLRATAYLSDDGPVVGTVDFAVSPLNDRIYVFDLEVDETQRRQHFGAALVAAAAKHAPDRRALRVTPIKILYDAYPFWNALRARRVDGLIVTEGISISDMDVEKRRWHSVAAHAAARQQMRKTVTIRVRGERWARTEKRS